MEGTGIVEGVLRYHPFLYDKETYPLDINAYTGTHINLRMKQGFLTGDGFSRSTVNTNLSKEEIENFPITSQILFAFLDIFFTVTFAFPFGRCNLHRVKTESVILNFRLIC